MDKRYNEHLSKEEKGLYLTSNNDEFVFGHGVALRMLLIATNSG